MYVRTALSTASNETRIWLNAVADQMRKEDVAPFE
jgi:hypothetical protein